MTVTVTKKIHRAGGETASKKGPRHIPFVIFPVKTFLTRPRRGVVGYAQPNKEADSRGRYRIKKLDIPLKI